MSYVELAKGLREHAERFDYDGWVDTAIWFEKAADAIEQLDKDLERAKEWASFWEGEANEALKKFQVAVASKPRWIPVTEALPEKRKYVLVRYKNNDMAVACWFDGDEDILFWRAMTDEGWCADCDTDPTHWMQLPMPPKEEA